ncbi:MAG: ABC transporter ATP-binding protein [Acidimicrobiales bacterium]
MRRWLRQLGASVSISYRADRRRCLGVMVLNTLSSITVVVVALWLKLLIDAAADADAAGALVAAGGLGVTGALGRVAGWGINRMMFPLKEHTGLYLDQRLIALSAGTPGIEHHERPEYLDQTELLRNEGYVLSGAGNTVAIALAMVVQALATGFLLASVNPWLLVFPLFALPSFWAGSKAEQLRQTALDATAGDLRLARHLFELATSPGPGKELRIFGLGNELIGRHQVLWRGIDRRLDAAGWRGLVWTLVGWSMFTLGYAGAVVLVVSGAVAGRVTLGSVVLALALLARVNQQVSGAVGIYAALGRLTRMAARYLWLIDYSRDALARQASHAAAPDRLVEGIELRGVAFRYPDSETDVLVDVDLVLPAGATVALVGDNGAGKSTLVKLLCRFYEPTAGAIQVDGTSLADIDLDEWRARLAAGFQDFARLELLAREDVGVGDLPRQHDRGAVDDALARAASTDLAHDLPDGLETKLGPSFDGGTELSGGQWQKLALARAMMRARPLVLVLDEPTASVDAETEHALFERYAGAARTLSAETGAITVLVSHRFSTVRMAQLIVVVDGGRVAEAGSHDELVARGGLYAELHELQARSYR